MCLEVVESGTNNITRTARNRLPEWVTHEFAYVYKGL